MHSYYYFKDGFVYVMDEDQQLYRYTIINNIETILCTENLIVEYTNELNKEPEKFRIPSFKDLDSRTQWNVNQFLLQFGLVQQHCFSNNGLYFFILEILGMANFYFHCFKNKAKTEQETYVYEVLLKELLGDLERQLKNLKEISSYRKEKVFQDFEDSTYEKYYLPSIEDLAESYDSELDFLFEANFSPSSFFEDPLLYSNFPGSSKMRELYSLKRECIRKLKQNPTAIYKRKQFISTQKIYLLSIKNILATLPIPFLISLFQKNAFRIETFLQQFLKKDVSIGIPNSLVFGCNFYILLRLLYNEYLFLTKGKELKTMQDPILTLRNKLKENEK